MTAYVPSTDLALLAQISGGPAGLLASQDPIASMRMFMKLAGGGKLACRRLIGVAASRPRGVFL